MDEANEMARLAFKNNVANHLTSEEIDEFASSAVKQSGTPSEDWEKLLGFKPEMKSYYEIHLYKPSDECPYIEKSYAKILADYADYGLTRLTGHPPINSRNKTINGFKNLTIAFI